MKIYFYKKPSVKLVIKDHSTQALVKSRVPASKSLLGEVTQQGN